MAPLGAREGWLAGRAAWPGVDVPEAVFLEYIESHRDPTSANESNRLIWTDLYLACGCASGEARALKVFEEAYFGEVATVIRRLRARIALDEARQLVRMRVFLPEGGKPPRIAAYAGRGALRGWFRVT